MSMLGYDVVAQEKGGYPSGYVLAANQVDLLENVKYTGCEAITLEQLALIFKNALNVRMITSYTVAGLGSGDILYYSTDNAGDINSVKLITSLDLKNASYHTGINGIEEKIWGVITNTRSKALGIYSQDYTNNIDVTVGNEQLTIKSAITDGADCYKFDYQSGIYTPLDFSELPLYQSGYERVFIYMRSSSAKVIVAVE